MTGERRWPLGADVLGTRIDAIGWDEILACMSGWASRRESRVVCICNVHSVVTASRDRRFADTLKQADLATPDGAPVAWMLRRFGHPNQQRINGPDLMERYCALAARTGEPIFLYGSTDLVLDQLTDSLRRRYLGIVIAGAISPPFRALSAPEDSDIVDAINSSGARTVWVGLGCPKQEDWMMAHRGRIHATMIGVGAAFDYLAGTVKRAPRWMQRYGLEWAYRWWMEPRRLTKRYLVTNSVFLALATRQLGAKLLARHS
jgi:N-acetylglucosaminyldiphosphoundecaprenol N-acetyl-beta-D-mannosaminyltransferase